MANIFTCRRPNGLGGGAIDHPDRSGQVPDQHYIPDVTEKNLKDDISMIHRQKTFIFDVLKAFISNFTYLTVPICTYCPSTMPIWPYRHSALKLKFNCEF